MKKLLFSVLLLVPLLASAQSSPTAAFDLSYFKTLKLGAHTITVDGGVFKVDGAAIQGGAELAAALSDSSYNKSFPTAIVLQLFDTFYQRGYAAAAKRMDSLAVDYTALKAKLMADGVQFGTSTGGGDVTTYPVTYFSSGFADNNTGYEPGKAFDGNLSNFYASDGVFPSFIGVDAGTQKTSSYAEIAPRTGFTTRVELAYVQGSNDGSNWANIVQVPSGFGTSAGAYLQLNYPSSQTYRYWRLYKLDSGSGEAIDVSDIKFFQESDASSYTTIYSKTFNNLDSLDYVNGVAIDNDGGINVARFLSESSVIGKNLPGLWVAGNHLRVTISYRNAAANDQPAQDRALRISVAGVDYVVNPDTIDRELYVIDIPSVGSGDPGYSLTGRAGTYSLVAYLTIEKLQ